MPVMLRVDDFLYTKDEEHISGRHTVENFMKFDAVIPRRYMLGVIPTKSADLMGVSMEETQNLSLDPRLINVYYVDSKFELAMHGVWHDEDRQDEFGYMYPFQIIPALEHGLSKWPRDWLHPKIYMPPHNVVNMNTVKSCMVLGFKAITGGPETDPVVAAAIPSFGMKYIESLPPFEYGRSDELLERGAVDWLRERHEKGETVVLGLHWTWEHNIGLDNLRKLIDQISYMLEDFDLDRL